MFLFLNIIKLFINRYTLQVEYCNANYEHVGCVLFVYILLWHFRSLTFMCVCQTRQDKFRIEQTF